MKRSSLQIKLLSKTGEVLSTVNAFSGQVTVLRAVSQLDLAPYRRALAGIPGSEKFAVTYNGETFDPSSANQIGFGEHFSQDSRRVSEYLKDNGVPEQTLEALVVSYGLERAIDLRCSSITPCEERRVRLLSASYQPERPLLLHEPFEPIASQWREKFAALLTSFARTANQIVLVTGTSYRPDSWIDNEYIARLQVGETIQKTIGFTSGVSGSEPLMAQLREMMKEKKAADEKTEQQANTPSPQEPVAKPFQSAPASLARPIMVGSLGIIIVGGLAIFLARNLTPRTNTDTATLQATPSNQTLQTPISPPAPTQAVAETFTAAPEPPKATKALDTYPEEIKVAILAAFEGGASININASESVANKSQTDAPNSNLFSLLESVGSGELSPQLNDTAPNMPPEENSDLSEEARRDQIRQRFLDAIRRAEAN